MSPIGSWVEVAMKLFGNRGYDALLSRGAGITTAMKVRTL